MDALSYLESRCSLRRNVLTGEISYAPHRSNDYKPLSKEGINTLILEAGRDGVALTETLINRYVNSTLVERWNPAEAWLSTLGEWDGEDHVYNLSQRIITSNPDWGKRFHKWMLQMVARWAGFGKTTFCSLLLPPELRNYYSGSVHLKSSAEVQELVTGNLLINMDEFYQDNTEQRYLARYLFSRSTPVFRQPYGVTTEPRRNYAALIATTGNLHPMTDAAGAAHLVCVEVERPIDLKTPIPYEQLYAQLKAELDTGVDFALTEEEREAMAVQNSPFQEADNLVKMVRLLYASPAKGKKAKAVYIDTIIDRLMQEYPYWTPGKHVNQDVGFALQEAGFTRSRIHGRSAYRIVPRDPRRFDFVEEVSAQEQETFDNNPLAKALLAGLGGLVKK